MKKTSLFKRYILDDEILVMPGVHDALTARIAKQAGMKAITIGGYTASAALLGQPDISLLGLAEMAEWVKRIADAVDIPILADGDTGHGGILNVIRTVKEMEKAGAAGVFIEDQVFPKRCGHMEGKAVIDAKEMAVKVKAAVDARVDPDFIIMARTDALAVNGLEEALMRANLYREAGADLFFVEAPETVEQMRAITKGIDGPCLANNIEGGKSPVLPAHELQAIGYKVVAFPVAVTYAVAKAAKGVMDALSAEGTTTSMRHNMVDFEGFAQIVDLKGMRETEKRYSLPGR